MVKYSEKLLDHAISDTPTVCIDGEYFPAKWQFHINDVVEQWVLVADTDIDKGSENNG